MAQRPSKISDNVVTMPSERNSDALRHHASSLLMAPESSSVIRQIRSSENGSEMLQPMKLSGMTVGEAAHAAEDPGTLKAMNASHDQIAQMLDFNPSPELFDEMVNKDKHAALEFAVQHPALQTHALHDVDDEGFKEDLRVRLTGAGTAA